MAYQFDKVRLLGYTHKPVFFENGTRYKILKNLKIQGTFYTPQATMDEGVGATWAEAELLMASAQDYQALYLNKVYFGIGKIININIDQGDHVTKQNYTFDLECYDEVDLVNNWLANGKNGICPNILPSLAVLIDKIEETISYEIDAEGNQNYSQNATARLNKQANVIDANGASTSIADAGTLANAIVLAATLIETFFSAVTNNFSAFTLGGQSPVFSKLSVNYPVLTTKNYNLVDGQLSFSKKITIPVGDMGNYAVSYAYDIQADANNVVTITEKGALKGLTAYPFNAAIQAAASLTSNSAILARVQSVLANYNPPFTLVEAPVLAPHPIQKSVVSDIFRGVFDFSTTFTNDPKYCNASENGNQPVSYFSNTQVSVNDQGVTEITEQGTITGLGASKTAQNPSPRYAAALAFYNTTVATTVEARVTAPDSSKKTVTKKTFTGSRLDGVIQYSVTASDLSDFSDELQSSTEFKKCTVEATIAMPVAMTYTYNVINAPNKYQIIQPQQQSTVGVVNMTVKLKGNRKFSTVSPYLAKASAIANDYFTTSLSGVGNSTKYIKSASYVFAPNTNDFTLTVAWNFFPGAEYAFGGLTLS